MKKKMFTLGGIIFSVLALMMYIAPTEQARPTEALAAGQEGTIVVSGSGEVNVKPDMAYVHLGAHAIASSAKDAQTEVNKKIDAIRKALKDSGVEDKHVQTSRFNVYPQHQYNPDGTTSKDTKYQAEHILKIEFLDIENLGPFIDKAVEAGANRMEHVQFGLQDPEESEHEALKLAVKKAETKASLLADSVGKKRGDVLQITDQAAQVNFPQQHFAEAEEAAGSKGAPTRIEAGEIRISQHVDIVYQLQ